MNTTFANSKQKQIPQNPDLMRSFKTTTGLAHGLTRERVTIQNELQKIGQSKLHMASNSNLAKFLLEEMRQANKNKKAEPIKTAEEKSSQVNKQEIKGTGFNMKMVSNLKGAEMIEAQRDSRRQRHIACLKECEKFVDQFYDNFSEKKNEIKERIKIFLERSDADIDEHMGGLTDELLLANEIGYVNGVWEKVNQQRSQRNEHVQHLRESLDKLKAFQQKGSGSYIDGMRQKLIDIAFYLEPQVDELMKKQIEDETTKYRLEHEECDKFYEDIVQAESDKFDALYQQWKDSVVRFHILKQNNAIEKFVARLNSKEFVNPDSRVAIFRQMKEEQQKLFQQRVSLIEQLNETHPKFLTKELVNSISESLQSYNEESSIVFDNLVSQLTKDMENTNEDIDIALYDLKDFIVKNDAELEPGVTFDLIVEKKAQPYADRRKQESNALIMNTIAYQEDFDFRMSEMTTNIVNFFKEFATCLDKNKEKLKQTEINFQVALANCGDHHDEIIQNQEDQLTAKVSEMERAIHHVMLNEKLKECFDLLDQIQRTYRNYNDEYIKILNNYPNVMDTFFEEFEGASLGVFKRFPEEQRERIHELFVQETQAAQEKLEAEALKKWEEEKKAEEAKAAEEAKKAAADAKGKKPPPAKAKGKDADKPNIDVPKLEVPEIKEFQSEMGKPFLIERSTEDIAEKLMQPAPSEEENQQDADKPGEGEDGTSQKVVTPAEPSQPTPASGQQQPPPEDGEENAEEPKSEIMKADIIENDFLDKAAQLPPSDPDGENTMVPDLIMQKERIVEILESALSTVLKWLVQEKQAYNAKCKAEAKTLQDQSVEELDENLRKQWPRKGRLEVEIFQERKGQITNHNRKYERQVRQCLEKYNNMEEEWGFLLEKIQEDFEAFQHQHVKLKENLPLGKNLAQLQGTSRREKDASQNFEEKCRQLKESLDDLSYIQPDLLVKGNNDMLLSCQLFENGGNYDKSEIEWYQTQMDEINKMISTCKDQRLEKVKELEERMRELSEEPQAEFTDEYKRSIEELSAKDGLGKTYGQPRRFAQERLRSEMTKCEEAQKGIDKILGELESLCEQAFNAYSPDFDYAGEKESLSIRIRVNTVSLLRMMIHYGKHLGSFKAVDGKPDHPSDLPRISYREDQEELELSEEEAGLDAVRIEEELEHLGPIGFKNSKEEYLKFPEAIQKIDQTCRDLVTKLYTGENAKYLVGDQKIPEYLSIFLTNLNKQVEEFKISCVRQLRASTERLRELCQKVPRCVFFYLQYKYTNIILNKVSQESSQFDSAQRQDRDTKDQHLQLFRPNLENPANKEMTRELNEKEQARIEEFKEVSLL